MFCAGWRLTSRRGDPDVSLMEQFKSEAAKGRNHVQCRVGLALGVMSAKDRADVEAALADATIPGTVINRVLRDAGYELDAGAFSVQRHRRGACACSR